MQFVLSEDSNKIFTNCSDKAEDANHAMLVVGYD
jgi:C1A family cysteine protease